MALTGTGIACPVLTQNAQYHCATRDLSFLRHDREGIRHGPAGHQIGRASGYQFVYDPSGRTYVVRSVPG